MGGPHAIERKGLVFACYMDPSKPAKLDPAYTARLNYETYLFADSTARALFLGDPVLYCGPLTDPVSRRRFRPDDSSPSVPHEGVVYYFEGYDQLELFAEDPEAFRLPAYTMSSAPAPSGPTRPRGTL